MLSRCSAASRRLAPLGPSGLAAGTPPARREASSYRRQFGFVPRLFVLKTPVGYRSQGRQADDMHEKNLEYDITSLDMSSGELRLIEIRDWQARPDRGTDAEREA